MFNIMEKKWIFFGVSIAIIVVGVISYFIQGFQNDIDFAGGITATYELNQQFDAAEAEKIATDALGFKPSTVQKTEETAVTVKFGYENNLNTKEEREEFSKGKAEAMTAAFKEKYGEEIVISSQDDVSPSTGVELARNAFWMALLAALAILVYITIRFEFTSGVCAVTALLHDVAIVSTVYTLFRMPVNTSFIAAILTVLGYSINATIVVFDRIRENVRHAKKETYGSIANKSIWQTLNRSINTTVTTLLTILVLYIVGVPSIKEFAFPIIVGIIAGTYSSIFIAGPLWASWKDMGVKGKAKA